MNDLNEFCKDYGWCFLSADHYPSISDNKSLVVFLLPKWSQSDLQIVASIAQKIIEKRIRVEVFDIDEIKIIEFSEERSDTFIDSDLSF